MQPVAKRLECQIFFFFKKGKWLYSFDSLFKENLLPPLLLLSGTARDKLVCDATQNRLNTERKREKKREKEGGSHHGFREREI